MIEVTGIRKTYDRKVVLNDVSFSIDRGECLAIIGKNGSGKSTLLNIMLDMETADRGSIRFDDQLIDKQLPMVLRKQIGAFLGDQILIEELSGQEYLEFTAGIYGIRDFKSDLDGLRVIFQFTDDRAFRKEKIANYSLGMKRKVALMSTLLHRPKYLILDEAFSALDYDAVNEFLGLLRSRKPEIHLILTSHILPYLEPLMDKVMILEEGEVTFYGPKSELDMAKLPFLSLTPNPAASV